jgi:hypothetical protein
VFITIILGYVLFMFIFALRFNYLIPYRTYQAVERVIIAGIVVGIASLLQPERLAAYQYGFLWLLGATLSFIVWSHVKPQSPDLAAKNPPFKPWHHIVGVVCAGMVIAGLLAYFIPLARPEPPYGYTQRQWERGLREPQKQVIIKEAEDNFNDFTIPYLVAMSLLPAAAAFFLGRELAVIYASNRPANVSILPQTIESDM